MSLAPEISNLCVKQLTWSVPTGFSIFATGSKQLEQSNISSTLKSCFLEVCLLNTTILMIKLSRYVNTVSLGQWLCWPLKSRGSSGLTEVM